MVLKKRKSGIIKEALGAIIQIALMIGALALLAALIQGLGR